MLMCIFRLLESVLSPAVAHSQHTTQMDWNEGWRSLSYRVNLFHKHSVLMSVALVEAKFKFKYG